MLKHLNKLTIKKWTKTLLILSFLVFTSCPNGSSPTPPDPDLPPPYTNIGLAPYAIMSPHFKCAQFKDSIKDLKSFHISWLWHTFGGNTDCIASLLADSRLLTFEIHLINEVCQRNGNCGSYEFLYNMNQWKYNDKLKKKDGWLLNKLRTHAQGAADWLYIAAKPKAKCYISGGLESNLSPSAARVLHETLRPIFPTCELVFNPVSHIPDRSGADVLEFHHSMSPVPDRCIENLDGYSIKFPGVPNNYKRTWPPSKVKEYINIHKPKCDVVYLWHHDYNCYLMPFVDPRSRPCSDTSNFKRVVDIFKEVK